MDHQWKINIYVDNRFHISTMELRENKITPSKTQVKFQLLLRSMYLLAGRKVKYWLTLDLWLKYMAKN